MSAGLSSSAAFEIAVATSEAAPPWASWTRPALPGGHESLRLDLEVTTPELDQLVELAYAHGAVAARMSAAGFGGAVVALVAETRTTPFVRACRPITAGKGRAYVCRASDGAGLHS